MVREYLRLHDTFIAIVIYGIGTKKRFKVLNQMLKSSSYGHCFYIGKAQLTQAQQARMRQDVPNADYYTKPYAMVMIPTASFEQFSVAVKKNIPGTVIDIYSEKWSEWWRPSANEFQDPLATVDLGRYGRPVPQKPVMNITYSEFSRYNKRECGQGVRIKGFFKTMVVLEDIHNFSEFTCFFEEMINHIQRGRMYLTNPSRLQECVKWAGE